MKRNSSPVFNFLTEPDAAVPWIKVCGITRLEDAFLALEAGADALGVNLWPRSPRYLSPTAAQALVEALPADVPLIAVIVLDETATPAEWRSLPVAAFQVHGAVDESDLPELGKPRLVAVAPERAEAFPDDPVIIDGSWGSGRQPDWTRLKFVKRRYVLAGGLNPDNVAEALRLLRPAGVDVCSGVETAPGIKDPEKLRRFIEALRLVADPGDFQASHESTD